MSFLWLFSLFTLIFHFLLKSMEWKIWRLYLFLHLIISFVALKFQSIVWTWAFNRVLQFGLDPAKTVIDLKISQPVALFGASIYLNHLSTVVCKYEKIVFFSKIHWIDWSNKVCIYKLIWLLGLSLSLMIVDFGYLSHLTVIMNKIYGIIDIGNIQISE